MGETNSSHKQSKLVAFFDGVKSEFKKIIWPDKASITRQTVAVTIISVFLGALIKILDMIIQLGLNLIA